MHVYNNNMDLEMIFCSGMDVWRLPRRFLSRVSFSAFFCRHEKEMFNVVLFCFAPKNLKLNLRRILFTGFPFEYSFLLLLMYDNIIYKLLKCITWYFDTYISKLKIQCYNQSAQLSCRNHCRINCKTWLIKIHSFNIQKYILKVFEKWFVYLYILVNRRKEDNIRI